MKHSNPASCVEATHSEAPEAAFRSGAVARMVDMPVATLRIWEQRYQAVRPATSASGQRLYSSSDVQRVHLLRQLTQRGQAIGSIAGLEFAQLQNIATNHLETATQAAQVQARAAAPLHVVVVGQSLATRLLRPAVTRRLLHPPQVLAVFDTLEEAARSTASQPTDLLLWQAPGLNASVPPALEAARLATGARRVGAVYRFGGAASKKVFTDGGVLLLREPNDDNALGAWLASLEPVSKAAVFDSLGLATGTTPPRRFDDATLSAVANMSASLACECPQHVAELLMQLTSFEEYSANCVNRSPSDAALHTYLTRVAGTARAIFESALEHVALHEGLSLH